MTDKPLTIEEIERTLAIYEHDPVIEQIASQFLATMQREARLREALEVFGSNKERVIDEAYDWDCPICGFNCKKADDFVAEALAVNHDIRYE